MKYLRDFVRFWYDFVVGDDWMTAGGVVLTVALAAFLVETDINAWWLLLIGVFGTLITSVYRAAH